MFMLFLFTDRMYYASVVSLFRKDVICLCCFSFSDRMYYVSVVSLFT